MKNTGTRRVLSLLLSITLLFSQTGLTALDLPTTLQAQDDGVSEDTAVVDSAATPVRIAGSSKQ